MRSLFLLSLLLIIPVFSFSQNQVEAMTKLKNIKELLELDLISQKEFDSISIELKSIILDSKTETLKDERDGFYIDGKILVPEKFAESKTDVLGMVLSSGIAGGSTKSYLIGVKSKNILDYNNQVLTLIIRSSNNRNTISNQEILSDIQSPNDFALVKFESSKKKDHRYIVTGSASLAKGYRFQIKKEEYIDFDWVKTNDGNFEIKTKLGTGSYAFVFVGTSSYSNQAVYTFEVINPNIKYY